MSRKRRRNRWTARQQRRVLHKNYKLWKDKFEQGSGNYVGLDFSLTSTGIAAVSNIGNTIDTRAVASTARDGTLRERLSKITESFLDILLNAGDVRVVAMEDINVGTNINSTIQLSMVSGAIHHIINTLAPDAYILYCNVSTIKKFATGQSRATKDEMIEAVYDRWNIRLGTDDEADAYAAARIADSLPRFFKAYGSVIECTSDIDSTLMDISKGRHEEFYEICDSLGLLRREVDALVGHFTGSATGGSGLKQLSENDKAFYYDVRDRLREL